MSDTPQTPKEQPQDLSALVEAFGNFNEAAAALNVSYRRLEERIESLTEELEEKDQELYARLRELDHVTRFLQAVMGSISSGVIAIDIDGKISLYNNRAAELIGIEAEEVVGSDYAQVFPEGSRTAGAMQTLQQGPELRGVEKQLPSSGTVVEVSTNWVVDSTGERVGVVEVFDDMTTLRRLEERFEQQKTLSALGEMASAVAHELRNPLAGIGGFAAILKEELADEPERVKLVDKLLGGVHDLEKVATNLLFLTRRTEIRRDETDLKALLTNLVELFEAEVMSNDSAVEIKADLPEETIMLAADGELLKMVFTNLGRNAMIALDGEGSVEIGLKWKLLNNKVVVNVSDNGCGIDKDNLSKLFNPFFTTRADGTGLGLALVKKAVDLHKGKILVESEPDVGTTFIVELPIRPFQPE